jgi:hypothetical protein
MDRAAGIDLVEGTDIGIAKTMDGTTAVYEIDFTGSSGGGGVEIVYAQRTSDLTISGTSGAGATTIVATASTAYDGSRVKLEFWCARFNVPASGYVIFTLWDGSDLGIRLGAIEAGAYQAVVGPIYLASFLTPSAANHAYTVKAFSSSGTADLSAASPYQPTFVRVTTE